MPFKALTLQENLASETRLWKDYFMAYWSETIIRGVGHPPSSLFVCILDPLRHRIHLALREKYADQYPLGVPSANLESRYFVLEDAVDWLIVNLGGLPSPYFAYFHLMPHHEPYKPRREFVDVFQDDLKFPQKPVHSFSNLVLEKSLLDFRRQYDAFLAYADAEFGRLFNSLSKSGLLENTYLILTSDHGQLFKRGIHGHITPVLYDPLLNIPLLIARPGQTKREDIYETTSAVDLLPTLLQVIGQPTPNWIQGKVLPGFDGESNPYRSVFALDAKNGSFKGSLRQASIAMVRDQYKLIHYYGYPDVEDQYELYDLHTDPEEMFDSYEKEPDIAADMQDELERILQKFRNQ